MKRFIQLSLIIIFFLFSNITKAQSCFNVAAGNDTTISCTQQCLDLKARIPDIRSTETYSVVSIPYAPYAYTTPGGTTDPLVDADDHFSAGFDLPFSFCFYGDTYKKLCVGSNGVLTFDVVSNASTQESYEMQPGNKIFYTGGMPNDPDNFYAPQASIFLAYYDMNPLTSPVGNKIEWRVEGTAPCRKFVVSFYHIGFYYDTNNPCPGTNPQNLCTMQAVLYEGTGIIDVFYENKPSCASLSNGNRSIAGLQNWARDEAVVLPGKNGTVWTAKNEGFRYVPSGSTSLLDSVSLFKNGVWVARGATTSLGNGELEATFSPICQPEDSMSYVVRAFYQQCDNSAIQTEGSDTIIVYKAFTVDVTATDALCNGNDGTITINSPVGSNIEYSIDGGMTWQASNIFTRPAGTYTIIARVVGSVCTGTTTATLVNPPPINVDGTVSDLSCNASASGTITITDPVGVDYEYSKDGGTNWQASPIFNNLTAANYTITINKISISCRNSKSFSVTEPTVLSASAVQSSQATCANNDGSITISANGGTPLYEYSVDNGANWQPSNILTGLAIGNYANIKVRDSKGCISPVNSTTVALNDTMRLELGADTTSCFGSNITLIPQTNALTDKFKWTPAATLNDDTVRMPIASPNDTTKYYLTAKWGPCVRTDSITVNVLRKPVSYAGKDTTICYKTGATLYGAASNLSGGVNYSWTPAATLATPDMPVTAALPDTTTLYFLTVTDNYGCSFSVTDSVLVTMNPKLIAFAGNDTNAVLNRPHQLMASGGVDYVWSPVGPLNNPFIANPLAILNQDTYFNVWVTDAFGCQAGDTVFIKVYEGPYYYLPNAFTPNGDRVNDIFRPIPVGIRSTDYFRVFNRYGQLMYETRQWMQGWDGTLKGKPAAPGAYVWIVKGIDKNGSVVEMKGTVILVR